MGDYVSFGHSMTGECYALISGKIRGQLSRASESVEDTSVFLKLDMLDQSIQNRETRKTSSAKEDQVDAKLVLG